MEVDGSVDLPVQTGVFVQVPGVNFPVSMLAKQLSVATKPCNLLPGGCEWSSLSGSH